ncbi:hypothetical protein B9T36_11055 [Acinetobacter sp. ANC 4204]|uniref:hypothetical protein n=1 Tax=Acinetobacter sp. ANC 4204 TaxID=1977884 RepID=UPI000A336A3F|nr:hypothetical protein [Acinetobacter sp. ANC 4204]OTG58868.1 hypothetical protein B9T36_11055 [Acinetobacter sp. ANC 4204]
MQVNMHSQIGARFKLIAHKGDGVATKETEWFNNIVLDTGLARMSVGTWISRCCVGTGNTTPAVTQTALASFLASTTSINSTSTELQTTTTPYYRGVTLTWRFSEGVAAGNISEVGMGWGNTTLWNRALVLDANGNPTTITVLSDEYLDVVAEIREYPTLSTTGSFTLVDKLGATLSTHTYTGSTYMIAPSATFAQITSGGLIIYSGVKNDSVTASPTTSVGTVTGGSDSYPTSTSIQTVYTCALATANGTHQSFRVQMSGLLGSFYYKFQISPTITKTSTQIMAYTAAMTWGRYTG